MASVVFMGTPDFAAGILRSLIGSGHEVKAVFTQPDRPKGRRGELQMPPVKALALENGIVRPEDLFFIGIRVAELDELELIRKNPGITTVTAMDIHEKGIEDLLQKLDKHFEGYDAIYFTIDIDGLDPAFAPGTGTPVMGGVTAVQLIRLFRWVIEKLPVKAMDIVEVAPDLDVNNITSWAALKIIHELFTAFSK